MPRQNINLGTTPSDGNGDGLRAALDKCNDNFVELYELAGNTAPQSELDDHLADTNNPHSVTKSQVGLGNVDNTSDASKPISSATQAALNTKLNANDASVTNARPPTGGAGGVLGGNYPNPSFAVAMATQAELDAVAAAKANAVHSHADATTGAPGFMSAADKTKLNGIAVGANNYALPAPSPTVMGGVKRNAGTAGQFVTGISSSGDLVYGTPSGGSTIATPRILHVTTTGNDTTGDGSLASPYATAQKAWDVAIAGVGMYVIHLGVVQQSIVPTAPWPARITVDGSLASYLAVQSTGYSVDIASNGLVQIELSVTGAALRAKRCRGANCFAMGSNGGIGSSGTPGDSENAGGNGGDGEAGQAGPYLTLIYCEYDNAATFGGAGGAGGEGGADGGAGAGSPGLAGSDGPLGAAYVFGSNIVNLTCQQLYYAQTNIADMVGVVSVDGGDFGGNSTMSIPAPMS